jgi:hypothetical protein
LNLLGKPLQTNGTNTRSQERAQNSVPVPETPVAARKALATCCALAILSRLGTIVGRPRKHAACRDPRRHAGTFGRRIVSISDHRQGPGSRSRDAESIFPTPSVPAPTVSRTRRICSACHRPVTCCRCPRGGDYANGRQSKINRRESHHIFRLQSRVNLIRGEPLSPETCSKFLNELAVPVNIAYVRQIMSRCCDITYRSIFGKEPRVVDATG